MRFIETVSGDYIAVDTIAKITDIKDCQMVTISSSGSKHVLPGREFVLITKRGERYDAKANRDVFFRLLLGA